MTLEQHRTHIVKTAYAVGPHEKFVEALSDAMADAIDDAGEYEGVPEVQGIDHAVTSHEGELHWSAVIRMYVSGPIKDTDDREPDALDEIGL